MHLLLIPLTAACAVALALSLLDLLAPGPSRWGETRRVGLTRLVGLALGGWTAWLVVETGSHGQGLLPAPAVFGLVVLVAVALGETVVRPPRVPGPRTASARPRRVRDYLPRMLAACVGLQAAALLVVMALTTATASRDDHTDSMRAIACSTATGGNARTPYPGGFYTAPLAAVLVAVAVVTVLTARRVVRRPRGVGEDEAVRAQSLTVVTAAAGVAVSAPYLGVAAAAGLGLLELGRSVPGCAPAWAHPTGLTLVWTLLPAFALLLACGVLLTGPPVRRSRRRAAERLADGG